MVTREDWIYLAGILDGEGYIGISKCGYAPPNFPNGFRTRIIVVNTDKDLIGWLKNTFGGYIYMRIPQNHTHSNRYEWIIDSKKQNWILKNVLPFLKIKKEAAIFVLKFRETIGEHISSRIYDFRKNLYQKSINFNSKIVR